MGQQRILWGINFSYKLKFLSFSLIHAMKIQIACIMGDKGNLCSKYKCSSDVLDNNLVNIIILTVYVTLLVILKEM